MRVSVPSSETSVAALKPPKKLNLHRVMSLKARLEVSVAHCRVSHKTALVGYKWKEVGLVKRLSSNGGFGPLVRLRGSRLMTLLAG